MKKPYPVLTIERPTERGGIDFLDISAHLKHVWESDILHPFPCRGRDQEVAGSSRVQPGCSFKGNLGEAGHANDESGQVSGWVGAATRRMGMLLIIGLARCTHGDPGRHLLFSGVGQADECGRHAASFSGAGELFRIFSFNR